MHRYPTVQCPLCRDFAICERDGFARAAQTRGKLDCFHDSRQTDIELLTRHFQLIAEREGVGDMLPPALIARVLEPVQNAENRLARPLEFSTAFSPEREHWCRFSVAYGDADAQSFAADAAHLVNTLVAAGATIPESMQSTLLNLPGKLVAQLLYGFDIRPDGGSRHKAYLRLGDGMKAAKKKLLHELLPNFNPDDSALGLERLRLIGLDFPEGGDAPGMKLYYTFDDVAVEVVSSICGPHALLDFLDERGERLREVLLIQRIGADGAAPSDRIVELDLHLLANKLTLADLLRFMYRFDIRFPMRRFVQFYDEQLVVPTSLTLSLADPAKMNLYYLLVRARRVA